jgi:prolyl 4-hydroxylase
MTNRELQDWILHNTEIGHPPEALLENLLAAGWNETIALDALEKTLRSRVAELGIRTVPEPDLSGSPTMVTVAGRSIEVVLAVQSPRLVVFKQFLSDEECESMIKAARPRLAASTVLDDDSGANAMHHGRVSDGMFFGRCESHLIKTIEERITELVRCTDW